MADGSVIIDTELDEGGLKKGLASMSTSLIKGVTVAVEAAGAALAGLGTYAIQVGSDFEAGMSNVAAISGATGNEIDALTEKAKEMGAKTKFSASEAADAFSYMAMAGWKTSDMLSGIEGVMSLAAASGEDLASVSDIVTDALTALGMSASDSGHFADVLAAASSNANTNVGLMGETFKYCASMAGSLQYSAEDLALAIGLMANSGLKGSMAGTSLNMIMTRLSTNTNGAREAIEELGVAFFNEDGSARSLSAVLGELREATAAMTAEQKANFANTVAGTGSQKGLLAILNASQADYDKLSDAIAGATNEETGFSAAAQMMETQMDNLQGDLTILKSATEGFGISLYDAMSSAGDSGSILRELARSATDLVNELNDAVSGENGLSGLASAIGSVLSKAVTKILEYAPTLAKGAVDLVHALIDGLVSAAPDVANAVIEIGTILIEELFTISGQLVELVAELMLSLGSSIEENLPTILSAVINGIGSLLRAIAENAPKMVQAGMTLLTSLAAGLLDSIPSLAGVALDAVLTLVDGLASNAELLLECITEIFDKIVEELPDLIQVVVEALPVLVESIISALSSFLPQFVECAFTLLSSLVDAIPMVIEAIVPQLPQIVVGIVEALLGMIPTLVECGITLLTSLVDELPQIILTIVSVLPTIVMQISAALLDNAPLIVQCGIDLLTSLIAQLPQIIQTIIMAMPTIITSIVNAFISNVGRIAEAGVQLLGSLIAFLPRVIPKIVSAVPQIVTSIVQSFTGFVGSMAEAGRNLMLGLANGIASAVSGVVQRAIEAARAVLNSVKSFFGIASPSKVFKNSIGKNLMYGLAEGIEDETDDAVKATEKAASEIADVDFDVLADQAFGVVTATKAVVANDVSASSASMVNGRGSNDSVQTPAGENDPPKYVEANIYIDGRKAARAVTPYVTKELGWEGK